MDARTVARIAGVKTGTLNAWVQRGLISGLEVGAKGMRREIDALLALRIVLFARLVAFNVATSDAWTIVRAITAMEHERALVVIPSSSDEVVVDASSPASPPRHRDHRVTDVYSDEPVSELPPLRWRRADGVPFSAHEERMLRRGFADRQRLILRVVHGYAELAEIFADASRPPGSFLVIDVGELAQRVRQAEAEWQESRGGKS